jgi:hypothetical protein
MAMARQTLSAPVSLILIIVGIVLMYSVLHAHGWNLYGGIPLAGIYRTLPMLSRALVVGGLIITAWGSGALINGLVRQK